ncbi:MAG: DUF2065 domain-containing protein [Burkholderiales bacterium]|nr:MAG: DUF2065 domain-containing protein [Burkholderiales bacterium]
MGESLLAAIGLVLIIEGIMPLAAPAQWRATVERIASLRDGQLRFVGLGAVLAGIVLLVLVRQL